MRELVKVYTHPDDKVRIVSEGWRVTDCATVALHMPDRETALYINLEDEGLKISLYRLEDEDIGECIHEELL